MSTRPAVTRILFATDFLGSSRLALDYAVAFARHFNATIVMVHALELPYPAREAESATFQPSVSRRHACERLDALAAGVRRLGINVESHVEDGVPSDVILRAVDRYTADLLVLGVHGIHRGLTHLLIGSNTEKILMAASCPVMTVGAHVFTGVDPELHFKELLYFSDFTPEATAAAPYAAFLSEAFQAPVDICQLMPDIALDNPRLRQDLADEYCRAITTVFPDALPEWSKSAYQLSHSLVFDEIIERAAEQHAGLIVLGIRTSTQLGRHLHTSFAYQLLAKASCPVLSVRYTA